MYWLRQSIPHTIPFFILFLVIWIGGWLLATHVLHVRSRERLTVGMAVGIVLYIVLCNLLAYVIGSTWAFIISGMIVLGLGLISNWNAKKPWLDLSDLRTWPQILVILIIGFVFTLILRGVAIWDDYHNLPVVSTIAAGNLPPKYYLDPSLPLSYHYGLHIFSASMVGIGGFTPWSAWDIARGFTTSLAIVLSWLWFRRVTGNSLSAYFGSVLLTFGGGTLWILSLLPEKVLAWLSVNTPLANSALESGPTLAANLSRPFLFEGSPAFPMPFSFLGGIFPPITVNWTGTSSLYLIPIFLLLLGIDRKHFSWIAVLVLSSFLSLIALNAEQVYLLLMAGIGIIILAMANENRRAKKQTYNLKRLSFIWFFSLILGLFQGGVITELVKNIFSINKGGPSNGLGMGGFFLQWPPAIISAYFKPLSVFNPAQLIVALADMGPAFLLIPIVIYWVARFGKRNHVIEASLGLASLISVFLPLFIHYGVERDTSRFTAFGLQTFLIISIPTLSYFIKNKGANWRGLILGASGASAIGGVVIFAILFTSIPTPQFTYFIDSLDARMSYQGWNRLEAGSQVLDRIPYRAVTLYGHMSHSSPASGPVDFSTYPEWKGLIDNPNPGAAVRSGYDYIYMDNTWWQELTSAQQAALLKGCVKVFYETSDPDNENWRRLLNVSACK
jgi:hypothetical protein